MRKDGNLLKYTYTLKFLRDEEGDYRYLRFKVKRGTKSISISYEYDEECIVDIGVFGPGSLDLIRANFRGWSGSNRKRIYLGEKWSTPGYIAEPIEEGVWHVILGLYKIPEDGCKVHVNIMLLEDSAHSISYVSEPVNSATCKRSLQEGGWLKGDLHVHTMHSDGDSEIHEIVEWARHLGLDFIGLTDHNTISHLREIRSKELLVIPGEELTTYRGHMNVLGVNKWVDFRIKCENDLLRILSYINREGFLPIVNHPKSLGPKWEWGHIEEIGFLEVWQGIWEFNNYESLRLWDMLLSKGFHVFAIGGSDVHRLKTLDFVFKLSTPTTWVYTEKLDVAEILAGIRNGKVVITEGANGPFINYYLINRGKRFRMGDSLTPGKYKLVTYVERGKGSKLRIITARGIIYMTDITENHASHSIDVNLNEEDVFLRLELVNPGPYADELYSKEIAIKALTNPIFIIP